MLYQAEPLPDLPTLRVEIRHRPNARSRVLTECEYSSSLLYQSIERPISARLRLTTEKTIGALLINRWESAVTSLADLSEVQVENLEGTLIKAVPTRLT